MTSCILADASLSIMHQTLCMLSAKHTCILMKLWKAKKKISQYVETMVSSHKASCWTMTQSLPPLDLADTSRSFNKWFILLQLALTITMVKPKGQSRQSCPAPAPWCSPWPFIGPTLQIFSSGQQPYNMQCGFTTTCQIRIPGCHHMISSQNSIGSSPNFRTFTFGDDAQFMSLTTPFSWWKEYPQLEAMICLLHEWPALCPLWELCPQADRSHHSSVLCHLQWLVCYHLHFYWWFPDFNSPEWTRLFGDSVHQYPFNEDDLEDMNKEDEVDAWYFSRYTRGVEQSVSL